MLDEVGRRIQDARDEQLALGQFHLLEQLPLVVVTWVASFERDGAWARAEHDVDDVLERNVEVVRALVVAPAQVHAQLLGRDAGHGVVQCLHLLANLAAELLRGKADVRSDVAAHGQVRAVQLEDEASAHDGFVLRLHSVGQGRQVGLVGGVVSVLQKVRDDTGRCRRHEGIRRLHSTKRLERGFEISDVSLDCVRILQPHRSGASWRLQVHQAGILAHALEVFRKVVPLCPVSRRPLTLEAGQAVLDVVGVAWLPHFPVADDLHIGLDLLLDDFGRCGSDAILQPGLVYRLPLLLVEHHLDQVSGAG